MNPRNTHHNNSSIRNTSNRNTPDETVNLNNWDYWNDDLFGSNKYADSDDHVEKVAAILQTLGAERLPPINMYDAVAHLSYRDIFFTELSIAVGDYTGFTPSDDDYDDDQDDKEAATDDEYVIEVGAVLAFGDMVDTANWSNALGVLDESVEPLRAMVGEPAFIEVSDQGDYNIWLILPLTAAAVEGDGITETLTRYLSTAISLYNELRNRLENGR